MLKGLCLSLSIFRINSPVLRQLTVVTHSQWADVEQRMIICRGFNVGRVFLKRRKTAEEKKTPGIVEFSPKKKNTNLDEVEIWRHMSVNELAQSMNRSINDVQEAMLHIPEIHDIEPETRLENMKIVHNIVTKCGKKSRVVATPDTSKKDEELDCDAVPQPPAAQEKLQPRFPVVTVMGHVDHGKTTLLDTLRGANVASGEAGGITQHIGAFTVSLENGEKVTFLDTPGHAAFSAMRTRGANITDIIVLVVAAEDGVMAQTREVIAIAKEAQVPIIVAINKIDKPEANIENTKRELLDMGLILEEHGGDIQVVPVSALKGTNLELLTEAISTQAALMGLTADHTGMVEGVVVESKTDARRGKLSTAIVTRGTLRKGAVLVSGLAHAKVRALFDHIGKPIELAVPGMPVEILGWRELPLAGEQILEVESERRAHTVLRWRQREEQKIRTESSLVEIRRKEQEHMEKYLKDRDARRRAGIRHAARYRWAAIRKKEIIDDGIPSVSIVVKGDVHGSVEAILDVLETYVDNDNLRLDIVHYGVGDVNEGDVELAKVFDAVIYAFAVKSAAKVPKNVSVRQFNVIYHLVADLRNELSKKLPPVEVIDIVGEAVVLQPFTVKEGRKEVAVAGSRCIKGVLKKSLKFRLLRDGEILYDGPLESMRHLKSEVDSIKKDVECGLRLSNAKVIPQADDTIICYTTHMEGQTTSWDPGF